MRILLSSEALFGVIAPVYTIWWTIAFFKIDRIKSFETIFNQWSKKTVAYRWEFRSFWRSRELLKVSIWRDYLRTSLESSSDIEFVASYLNSRSTAGHTSRLDSVRLSRCRTQLETIFIHLPTKVYIIIEVRWVFKTLFSEKDHGTNTDVPQGSLFGPFFFVFEDLPKSIFRSFGKYLCRFSDVTLVAKWRKDYLVTFNT